jgi:PhoH-like ATPase
MGTKRHRSGNGNGNGESSQNGKKKPRYHPFNRYKNIYVIDTDTLEYDPNVIENLGDNVISIPMSAIVALDNRKKGYSNDSGESVLEITRQLDEYRKLGSLSDGVKTRAGGLLVIAWETAKMNEWPSRLPQSDSAMTIMLAKFYQNQFTRHKVALISTNKNTRLLANSLGVNCEDYKFSKVIQKLDELYSGFIEVVLEEGEEGFLTELHTHRFLDIKQLAAAREMEMYYPNQCCRLVSSDRSRSSLAIFKKQDFRLELVRTNFDFVKKRGVAPKNPEQCFLYHLLMDPEISLVTCAGKAGTGKNLIASLAGLQLLDENRIVSMEFYRPMSVVEKSMGFLPGNADQKFGPWSAPIFDTFSQIKGEDISGQYESAKKEKKGVPVRPVKEMVQPKVPQWLTNLMDGGVIEINPLTYIRGRSIPNRLIIVDETQNISPHVAKTIVTRAGANTKVVLIGDPAQIDESNLDYSNNGLAHVIQRCKEEEMQGHITLITSERSPLAEMAANRL